MKVQIKQLEANPYRDMDHYPISEEKVQRLAESIHQTGFWDNILARKADGKIQIAYGHHRLMALRKVMKPTDEVDIPVKSLDDATMLKIMANENMDEWATSTEVIDETIKAVKTFLEVHREELKKHQIHGLPIPAGAGIAGFLGWPESRVTDSLKRLRLYEEGKIEREAIKKLPSEHSSRHFVEEALKFKATPAQQKRAADIITKKQDFSETGIRGAITEQIYRKPKPEHKDFKLIELREEIKAAEKLARDLSSKLLTLTRFREEIKDQVYRVEVKALAIEFNVLIQRLKSFIGGKNNVKQLKG